MVQQCRKCGATFATNQKLQRHLARKRPCDPVVADDPAAGLHRCQHCGRRYSRSDSLQRHNRTCRVANGAVVNETVQDFSLRKQREAFEQELAKRDEIIAGLASRVEQLAAHVLPPIAVEDESPKEEVGPTPQNNDDDEEAAFSIGALIVPRTVVSVWR
jgi:Zinc finger, C2H2 type